VDKARVGIIGCGNISTTYFKNCRDFEALEVVACADLDASRAQAKADEFGVRACSVEALLGDPQIEIVLNLTSPNAHAEVNLAALAAGKHTYTEKPLAVTREAGERTLAAARVAGRRVGCAPDTVLGGGLQTCRELIDDGAIGQPVAAVACMPSHGPEGWHPDPEFFYKPGAGPLFDMAPYYLTALISLLGPVERVSGAARISFPERLITSQPRYGQKILVETPTHVVGLLEFAAGPIGTLLTSFDIWAANLPRIEVYGSQGSLSVPDPNTFGGKVQLWRPDTNWQEIPLTHGHTDNSRGLGLADMAQAIHTGRPHRANGELGYHVLDCMHAILEAARSGRRIELTSQCERPAPMPISLERRSASRA
jgi:predicted dehydrogenase